LTQAEAIRKLQVVEAVTGRRIYWLGGTMLAMYAVSLALIGLAAGFDHSSSQWLMAGGLAALAAGLSASALLPIAVVLGDRDLRVRFWIQVGPFTRAWRAFFLLARVAVAVLMWVVALRIVER